MKLFNNPVTKEGSIRYFEVLKLFLFVLFLFGLYSKHIVNVNGLDNTSYVLSMVIASFLCFNMVYQTSVEINNLIKLFIEYVSEGLKSCIKEPFIEKVFSTDVAKTLYRVFRTKELSVYCVFRC